jgi:hypothetical protein
MYISLTTLSGNFWIHTLSSCILGGGVKLSMMKFYPNNFGVIGFNFMLECFTLLVAYRQKFVVSLKGNKIKTYRPLPI